MDKKRNIQVSLFIILYWKVVNWMKKQWIGLHVDVLEIGNLVKELEVRANSEEGCPYYYFSCPTHGTCPPHLPIP